MLVVQFSLVHFDVVLFKFLVLFKTKDVKLQQKKILLEWLQAKCVYDNQKTFSLRPTKTTATTEKTCNNTRVTVAAAAATNKFTHNHHQHLPNGLRRTC